jgi:chromosome segregation ATPase
MEIKEAGRDVEAKKAYQDKVEAELRSVSAMFDLLQAQAEKAKAKAELEEIFGLRAKEEAAYQKLQELKQAGVDTWERVKAGVDTAAADLKQSLERFSTKLDALSKSCSTMREAEFTEIQARIEQWSARADLAKADVKLAYQEEIEAVRAKEAAVQRKLEELKRAGEGAKEDIKAGFETAWQNLRTAFDAAAKRFK